MVEDLKELSKQQSLTIKQLEEESLSKSNKISSLICTDGKANLCLGSNKRPTLHLSSHLPSSTSRYTQPPMHRQVTGMVDTNRLMQKKVEQITEERNFWKRHFQLAEGRISDLINERNNFQPQHAPPLQEISINKEPESLYLKKLLEENLDLKSKLSKQNKVSKNVQILDPETRSDEDSSVAEKENCNYLPKQSNIPVVAQPQPQSL